LLAGKTLTINVFLKILGSFCAEDYWQSAVYQLFTDQHCFYYSHGLAGL